MQAEIFENQLGMSMRLNKRRDLLPARVTEVNVVPAIHKERKNAGGKIR